MSPAESQISVELWSARIPGLGLIAEHHWFVVSRLERNDRWEVWQVRNAGGESWDHLYRNLMRPSSGVGNGPAKLLRRWIEGDAVTLADRIEQSPSRYPWTSRYRYFPGPNSNTFAQWVLGPEIRLGWRGIGRNYRRRVHPDWMIGPRWRDSVSRRGSSRN